MIFKGPIDKFVTTDFICFILFILINSVFVYYAYSIWLDGAWDRLSNPVDFRAELCGKDHLEGRDYLYYANPIKDINVRFCVKSCPESTGS